jgi:predicted nucleotidyltransferase
VTVAEAQLHPQVAAFARDVVDAIDEVVPVIEGFVLGSAALGAFDASTSDIDMTVVVAEPLGARRAELVRRLAELEIPFRDLELVAYVAGSRPPELELNFDHGQERPDESRFWFVLDAALAEEHALPVLGRHRWNELFGPVGPERVDAAMRESLAWAEQEPAENEFARLHAVRARRYLEDGVWISKTEAREEAER